MGFRKKAISIMLAAALVLMAVPANAVASTTGQQPQKTLAIAGVETDFLVPVTSKTEVPAGYTGIYTKADLDAVRSDLTGYYILMNDIAFDESDFLAGGAYENGGAGWQPIGEYGYDTDFTGIFDGNGHQISGLQVDVEMTTSAEYLVGVGLFGASSGEIKNLAVLDASISGYVLSSDTDVNVGAVVGENDGVVTNCVASGQVAAPDQYSYTGGIAGENYGTVRYSKNYCAVSSYEYSGGIAGDNEGTITNCANYGTITASNSSGSAGGIVAGNWSNVFKCLNAGNVTAMSEAAGIAGSNYDIITNCFNTGLTTASGTFSSAAGITGYNGGSTSYCYSTGTPVNTGAYGDIGGVIGFGSGTVAGCYYLAANTNTNYGVALTSAQLAQAASYSGFDFSTVWTMSSSLCRPVLKDLSVDTYAISYVLNGGTLAANTPTQYMAGANNALTVPTKTGFAFAGWFTTNLLTGSATTKIPMGATGAKEFYAKWGAPITSVASYNYNSNKVSWAYAGGATSYRIYRATSATGTYSLVYTAPSTARSWVNTGLVTGKYYYYKVYPVVGTQSYIHSTYKYAKPIPTTPGVAVSKYTTTSIKVAWTGVTGATKYQVYRATSPTGTYSLVYTAPATARSWVNTGRAVGATYYYKVRAYHLEGTTYVYGGFSTVKSLKL